MVNNIKCDSCKFQTKCLGFNKLKPFLDEARVDLGVELDFVACTDYAVEVDEEESEDE